MPKEEEEKSHIPTRISFVFLIVFILFSVLIFRVAYIQLIEGKDYLFISEVNSTKTIPISAPRGWILDKNGEVLVDNKPVYTVTFQEDQRLNINKREVAQRLIKFLKDREVDEWIKLNNREQLIKKLIS